MKITGIEIGEYRQFKNIKFDFTYPEGHAKAGQSLEKVCFIGQSGTGKTTLLNVIWDFFNVVDTSFQRLRNNLVPVNDAPYETFKNVSIFADYLDLKIRLDKKYIDTKADTFDIKSILASSGYHWLQNYNIYEFLKRDTKEGKLCLYIDEAAVSISKNLLEEKEVTNSEIIAISSKEKNVMSSEDVTRHNSIILGLNQYTSESLWSEIVGEIDTYDSGLKQLAASLVSNNSFSEGRLVNQLRAWRKENPNPRADIGKNCLNRILELFHLEVDEEGTEVRIALKTKQGVEISRKYISTGTKQLISTSVPIYKLNLNKGVVLFDEPERSLFPDIQKKLITHYTSFAPEAQFFFATHSPIIAASFEPEERFILYFDEEGNVKCRKGVAPIGDDPNDVLRKDFGMSPLMQEEGLEAYRHYVNIVADIKKESDINRKMELIAERSELGNRYNFSETDETN